LKNTRVGELCFQHVSLLAENLHFREQIEEFCFQHVSLLTENLHFREQIEGERVFVCVCVHTSMRAHVERKKVQKRKSAR